MGSQNQVGSKYESVTTGRQMGLSCVQGAKSSKNLNIYHSNHTCPCGAHIKCKKYSKQAQITLNEYQILEKSCFRKIAGICCAETSKNQKYPVFHIVRLNQVCKFII